MGIKYTERKRLYKYQTVEDYEVQLINEFVLGTEIRCGRIILSACGLLTLLAGFSSDGPSGPTIDTKSFMRGAFVHDAIYSLLRRGRLAPEYRKFADQELRRLCLEDGMYRMRAALVYRGVRWFGAYAAKHRPPSPVIEAP